MQPFLSAIWILLRINTWQHNQHRRQHKKYKHRNHATVASLKLQRQPRAKKMLRSSDSFSRVHVLLDECVGCVGGELGGEIPVILWVNPRLSADEQKDAER